MSLSQTSSQPDGIAKPRDSATSPYFSQMKQLGPQVYFYQPTSENAHSTQPTSHVPQPDLVIMCSWMAAAPRHIEKYTSEYLSRHPDVPLLLIRSSQLDIMLKTERWQHESLGVAVTAVESIRTRRGATREGAGPRVLVHAFSNGGSWSACMLAIEHKRLTSRNLPVSALVLDSCPSLPDFKASYRALAMALPRNPVLRLFGSAFIWGVLVAIAILNGLFRKENIILKIRRLLNDPEGPFIVSGVPRTYICSKTDALVPLDHVQRHAQDTETLMGQKGFEKDEIKTRVRFEEFIGSPHVGHMVVDKERYWKIVDSTWEEGVRVAGLG